MKSLKAIASGSLFIIIASLLLQLAALFIIVGYNHLAMRYPFLDGIGGYSRYFAGIPSFLLIMFAGGYITALVETSKVIIHCLIVGLLTTGVMMYLALSNGEVTVTGMIVMPLMVITTIAGGLYRQKNLHTQ